MNRRLIASAVCAFSMVVGVVTSAQAAPLAPGGTAGLVGTNVGADPSLQGIVVASVASPFIGLDVNNVVRFTGLLESHVVQEVGGTMSFYYQVTNSPTSLDAISQLTNTDFGGWTTNVEFRTDAMLGIVGGSPNFGLRAAGEATRGAGAGDEVRFHFLPEPLGFGDLGLGETSRWLVIRTNAPAFTLGNTAVINGGNANVVTFAPIPEPATMGLVALGAVALLRRRR